MSRAVKELRGFVRVALEPGESKTVELRLSMDQITFHDRDMRLIVEPGVIQVMVGASSEDIRLEGQFEVTGPAGVVPPGRTLLTEVTVR